MEYIKICGLKSPRDIKTCMKNGASAIGFIYNVPESPRNLEKTEIINLLALIEGNILTVGVIKPQNIEEIGKMMNEINVDLFQIHLNFNINELMNLPIMVRKRLIVVLKLTQNNLKSLIEIINNYKPQFYAFLIDKSEGQGIGLDLDLAQKLISNTIDAKIILAGGIGIDNVESIMRNLRVYGIDVSSSLESERGIKDPIKIKEFLDKIKEIKDKLKTGN